MFKESRYEHYYTTTTTTNTMINSSNGINQEEEASEEMKKLLINSDPSFSKTITTRNVFWKIVTFLFLIYITIMMVIVLGNNQFPHEKGVDSPHPSIPIFHNEYRNMVVGDDNNSLDEFDQQDQQLNNNNGRRENLGLKRALRQTSIKPMNSDSLHWKNCSYNLNFTETTRRFSNEYHNYFNDGMMAPVIGKIECQEIRFFAKYSDFKISFFGMFYSKVVSFIERVNANLFTQDSHLFYPITSAYQVISVEGDNYIDICGDASKLVLQLTNGKELLDLYPGLNFTSCEQLFCNVNQSLYDPFNLYFRAQNYSQIYKSNEKRANLYRDFHILSILTNRCQYCKSESQFRTRVQKQECPFMVNYPARSAERACLGKNGFAVFYPYMSLDQYLQTTGNPFMCYCYENNIYASRCDSIHTFIYPIYQVMLNAYLELAIETVLFIVITFVLVLPLIRDIRRRGKYFFTDFDMILRALSVIPFWLFRLVYCILKLTVGVTQIPQDDKSSRFVNTLISTAMDTIGFDYVFIPLVIKWNQTYQKIKLYANQNSDISKKTTYISSVTMFVLFYSVSIACGLVIIVCAIILKQVPHLFDEDGSGAEWLIVMILVLIGTPIFITLMGFFILSFLIQRKLKQASDVSFLKTNYISTSRTYTLVSMAQFIPTLISTLTLYFGYDSIMALVYFFSSTTMQITTDALEIYVIFLLADKISLKEFYYDMIWVRMISPIIGKCFKKKVTNNSMNDTTNSATTTSGDFDDVSNTYYSKMSN